MQPRLFVKRRSLKAALFVLGWRLEGNHANDKQIWLFLAGSANCGCNSHRIPWLAGCAHSSRGIAAADGGGVDDEANIRVPSEATPWPSDLTRGFPPQSSKQNWVIGSGDTQKKVWAYNQNKDHEMGNKQY